MVTTWLEQWEELLRPGAGWTKGADGAGTVIGRDLERFWDTWKTVFLLPSSPMWKRHSVKRKTGGDGTQRQHEGRVSYPPPDLKGKVNKSYEDAMRTGIIVLQTHTFLYECSCIPRVHIRRKDKMLVLDLKKNK